MKFTVVCIQLTLEDISLPEGPFLGVIWKLATIVIFLLEQLYPWDVNPIKELMQVFDQQDLIFLFLDLKSPNFLQFLA